MTTIQTPGSLLANLPGILGYYPEDSLIVVTLGRREEGRCRIGPVLRLDLCDIRYAFDIGDMLDHVDVDAAFVFVISETIEPEQLDDLRVLLRALNDCGLLPVQQCWFSKRITTGERYQELALDNGPRTLGHEWYEGTIPPISQSVSLHAMLEAGELPMLSRQEGIEYFEMRPRWAHQRWAANAERQANEAGKRLAMELYRQERKIDEELETLAQHVDAAAEVMQSREASGLRARHVKALAPWFSNVFVRDAVVEVLLRDRERGRAAALAVARCYRGEIRSNALCLFAVCSIGTNASFRVPFALECAKATTPKHRLTQLLDIGYRKGNSEVVLGAVIRGSASTLEDMRGKTAADAEPGC